MTGPPEADGVTLARIDEVAGEERRKQSQNEESLRRQKTNS
jgi:hypothetical protein